MTGLRVRQRLSWRIAGRMRGNTDTPASADVKTMGETEYNRVKIKNGERRDSTAERSDDVREHRSPQGEKRRATAANVPLRGVAPFRCHGLIDHVSWKKDKKMARSAVAEAMAGQGDGTRRRSGATTCASIAARRARSAGQPLKKSRFLRHAESNRVKRKNLKCKPACELEIYCFYRDFLPQTEKNKK